MIITAHQPLYLPWLGFFDKIIKSDVLCILDEVQFSDGDFIHRNKIRSNTGPFWITLPIDKKNHLQKKISEIEITQHDWYLAHLDYVAAFYKNSTHFDEIYPLIYNILEKTNTLNLAQNNTSIIRELMKLLGIKTEVILLSELGIISRKNQLILDICKHLNATKYISGIRGKDYLDVESFRALNVEIQLQEYLPPIYKQKFEPFIPGLSIIDLLLNEGRNSSEILRETAKSKYRRLK